VKRVSSLVASLLVLAALLAPAANAAPGDLDPSFGAGGSERFFLSDDGDIALRGVAVQPDGKIVLAGNDQASKGILVVRLLPGGGFDPSFGVGGAVITTVPGGFAGARAVAVQPDGKVVVAGEAKGAADNDVVAARYEANGTPDPSFGDGDGIEIVPLAGTNDRAAAVTIGANKRILLTGEARSLPMAPFEVQAEVVVLQTGGKPDPAFDTDGIALVKTPGAEKNDQGQGIAEQADGKIVVADASGAGAGNGFTIVRLLPVGTPDPEFGGTGVVNTPILGAGNAKGRATDVLVQPDGRIVASGYGYDEVGGKFDSKFVAIRYLSDGKLDTGFGGAGTGIFARQVGEEADSGQRIALTPSGKLILAGNYALSPSTDSLAVLRLDSAGVLDPTFGAGGIALRGPTAQFGNSFEDAALDSRERVVTSSRDYIGNNDTEVEVSRFLGDVAPEPLPGTGTTPLSPPGAKSLTPAPKPPHAMMKALPRKLEAANLTGFSGTATAPAGSRVAKVQIALVLAATAKAGSAATCQELKNAKGQFKTVKAKAGNCPLLWLTAKGTGKWSFKLKTVLPVGRYTVYARAIDSAGLAESSFSRAAGNRFGFRLLAPPEPLIRNP
jgi:uncharacterized delta-60 repeat protein